MKIKIDSLAPILTVDTRGNNNLGDTFIGVGLQYLFERIIESPKWLLLNKYNEQETRALEKYIREAGFMILGGMPQYHNFNKSTEWHDKILWIEMVKPWNLKMFTMAGGAGMKGPDTTSEEFIQYCNEDGNETKELLQYRKKYSVAITTRDIHAHKLLLSEGIDNSYLPCGATFASKYHNIQPAKDREYLALVLPQPRMLSLDTFPSSYQEKKNNYKKIIDKNDSIIDKKSSIKEYEEKLKQTFLLEKFINIYNKLKKDYKVKIICHVKSEFDLIKSYVPMADLFFSNDYSATLRFYSHCHTVISGRLHGSLPAYGIPGTKIINLMVDIRSNSVKIFPKIQNFDLKDFTAENMRIAIKLAQPSESNDLDPWLAKYDEIITNGIIKLEKK